MDRERRKEVFFSLDQFVIFAAWLLTLFAILYFRAHEFIIPSIAAFLILNLAIGAWLGRFIFPLDSKGYKKFLFIQTVFLVVWCPLLGVIFLVGRRDLIWLWATILVVFYFGIGLYSKDMMLPKKGKK